MADEVSHGRGGAGNIGPDSTPYGDGEIVRAGVEGSHEDGPFSTGRGGTGNIGDAAARRSLERTDKTIVPEAAVRPSADLSDFHTGRGGAGNVKRSMDMPPAEASSAAAAAEAEAEAAAKPAAAKAAPLSVADKLKSKLVGVFKK